MTFYRFARAVVCSVLKVLFAVRVTGYENVPTRGVYIVAPSHRSILDIPFAAFVTKRRIRFMAKRELFSSKFGARLFHALRAIPVDRGNTDRAALRAFQEALREGEPVGIFPEGTRYTGRELGALFDGAAYVALKLGVPIIPVGIGGSEEILEKGRVVPRLHKVRIVIGKPLVPPPVDGRIARSKIAALTDELRVSLQACLDEARSRAGV